MSLAKIPFVLAFTVALRRSFTAPNPPPPDKGLLKQAFGKWYTQKALRVFTGVDLFFSALEISIILISRLNIHIPVGVSHYFPVLAQLHHTASVIHPTSIAILASLMMLTGALIRVTAYRTLGRLFTFESSIQPKHRLVTSGLYSFVRHPSYAALFITNPAWFLWHFGEGSFFNATRFGGLWWGKVVVMTWGSLFLGAAYYLAFGRMHSEDSALKQTFGKKWDEYAERVPYSILPGVY